MKLSLEVLTAGKWQGKMVPVAVFPFLIGRDTQCHLRPASPLISNRHCALVTQGGKVFVQDYGSTNGTFVNGRRVEGEMELAPGAHLQVGPIAFTVHLQTPTPVSRATPLPPNRAKADSPDDAAAALLLSLKDETDGPAPGRSALDDTGIPTGRTQVISPSDLPPEEPGTGERPATPPPKKASGDTSTAAKAILEKYLRRTR